MAGGRCLGNRQTGARCISRPVATGRVSCVCDWLRDATGLDSGDRSWICNAALVYLCHLLIYLPQIWSANNWPYEGYRWPKIALVGNPRWRRPPFRICFFAVSRSRIKRFAKIGIQTDIGYTTVTGPKITLLIKFKSKWQALS